MTDHRLDEFSYKEWINDREKVNTEECFRCLCEIKDLRIQDIIIKRIFLNTPVQNIAHEYHLTPRRIYQLYKQGINEIKRKLGLIK